MTEATEASNSSIHANGACATNDTSDGVAPVLTDGVIILRQRTLADVDAQIVGQDAEIVKWLDWDAPTTENVTAMIEASMRAWQMNDGRCDFGVYSAATGELIGNSLANFADPLLGSGEVNLAYAVFTAARGNGVAKRVVNLLCDWIERRNPSLHPILKIDAGNVASKHVAKQCRFTPDGSIQTDNGELERWIRSAS
jgi:RimJ/RimL family protein N-acetyltransferase